jgi:chemotaxis protein MotB
MARLVTLALIFVAAACGSNQPKPDPRIASLEKELADAKDLLVREKQAADELRKSDAELKAKADEAAALQAKLAEAVGKAGEVTTADGAVKLELVDQILFPTGEADLTPTGKEVLAKVGAALREINNKQIWVQGHTDDQPIFIRKKPEPPPPAPPPAKGNGKDKKPAAAAAKKPAPPPPPPQPPKDGSDAVLAFVTNWELSAARALTVVHYLQDDAKIDPTRLAAVAFSQYRPVSKNRAKNRRIEIVLYPRVAVAPK